MSPTILKPSTVDSGYTLQPAPLENPVTSDPYFQRVLDWYLSPEILNDLLPRLTKFGDEALSEPVLAWIANAEKEQPFVKQYDAWGQRYPYDKLVTAEGWKKLGEWGAKNGVVSLGYEPENGVFRRLVQHSFNYIFSASSAVRSCPVSMTSGAARLIAKHLPELADQHPFHRVFQKLVSREDAWVSSQWMTERPGGSDVRNSETVAVYLPLAKKTGDVGLLDVGDYLLSGFKWFTSAADCDVALILAKTESGELSLFLAPTKRTVTGPDGKQKQVTNGIRIHRMKNKMGTKELPTAELELKDVRAWMIGLKDKGISTIALLLNVTRTHNFITALSCWRRTMHIAKSFAKARRVLDQPLWTFPMHLRLLSDMEVKHRGALQLAFFTTSLLSFADYGHPEPRPASYVPLPEPGRHTEVLLRTLTATAKAIICKVATLALQECQEAMGGVGYMDDPHDPEFNISRLFRDTAANMTWEGTTNVLASELVRHMLNKDHLDIITVWMTKSIDAVKDGELKRTLATASPKFFTKLAPYKNDVGVALADGRQYMFTLGWLISGILLALDAQRDDNEVAQEVAKRWIMDGEGGVGEFAFPQIIYTSGIEARVTDAKRRNWDCKVVWGMELPLDAATGYRPKIVKPRFVTIPENAETSAPAGASHLIEDTVLPYSPVSSQSCEIPSPEQSYVGRSEYIGCQVPFNEDTVVSQRNANGEHGLPDLDIKYLRLRKVFDIPPRSIRESLIDAFMERGFWVRIGVELAYQVGLHKEPADGPFKGFKRRLWWILVTRDSIISVGTGRPRTIHLEDSTVKPPILADFPVPDTNANLFIAYVTICRLMGDVAEAQRRQTLTTSCKQRLEDALFRWLKGLQKPLQISHQQGDTWKLAPYNFEARQLGVPYFVSLIMLHRPTAGQASTSTVCLLASSFVVAILEDFVSRDQLRYLGPVFTFYALAAGLVQLTAFRHESLHDIAEHESNVIKITLEELGKRWGSAHGALRGLAKAKEAIQQQPRIPEYPPPLDTKMSALFADFGPELCRMWNIGFENPGNQARTAILDNAGHLERWNDITESTPCGEPHRSLQNQEAVEGSTTPSRAGFTDLDGSGVEGMGLFEDSLAHAEGSWLFEDLFNFVKF
ncbi:Acyl- dehydrogenase [Fusarium albosuccineum]|uniref:Acyl- dehydrogenase n=1 Tax=Fusarium albosuccineum TaxID=1237068 RepID=A0A8H4PMH4_9HYPO|nr:Acyl- dehydrogenase [Fusarium albosuccineum]